MRLTIGENEAALLKALRFSQEKPQTVRNLSEVTNLGRASIHSSLLTMEGKGWILCEEDPSHTYLITLTELGGKALDAYLLYAGES